MNCNWNYNSNLFMIIVKWCINHLSSLYGYPIRPGFSSEPATIIAGIQFATGVQILNVYVLQWESTDGNHRWPYAPGWWDPLSGPSSTIVLYWAFNVLPQICTDLLKRMSCSLKQMQYRFTVIYDPLSASFITANLYCIYYFFITSADAVQIYSNIHSTL